MRPRRPAHNLSRRLHRYRTRWPTRARGVTDVWYSDFDCLTQHRSRFVALRSPARRLGLRGCLGHQHRFRGTRVFASAHAQGTESTLMCRHRLKGDIRSRPGADARHEKFAVTCSSEYPYRSQLRLLLLNTTSWVTWAHPLKCADKLQRLPRRWFKPVTPWSVCPGSHTSGASVLS